jgi:hypothetical protein
VDEGDLVEFDAIVTDQGPNDTFVGNVWLVTCDYGQTEEQGFFPFEHFEFTPTDSGICTVEFHVSDDDAGEGIDIAVVTVDNVVPSATFSNDGPINEGGSATVSFADQFDPSSGDTVAGFHYAYSCTNGSLAGADYASSGSSDTAACTFADDGSYIVRARIIDDDDGFTEYTTTVIVNNVAPTTAYVSGDATVLESGVVEHEYVFSIFDPGDDTVIGTGYACGVNGLPGPTPVASDDTSITFYCIFPDGPANYVIQANATDSDHATGPFSFFTVHADNVAPAASINGAPASSPEGAAVSLGSSVTDASSTDTAAGFTYAWSVSKNGAAFASGTASTVSFTPDDNATYVVTLNATDKDGGTGTAQVTIDVFNVDPTVIILGAAPLSRPEGSAINLTSAVSDPSSVDAAAGFSYTWSVTRNGTSYASGSSSTFSFTPDDDGAYVVSLSATDKDGGSGVAPPRTFTVFNVAPTASLANGGPVGEGSPASITFSGESDPSSADTAAGFHYSFACSGGAAALATTYATATNTSGTTSCTFGDDGTYQVLGRIFDKDDGSTTYSTDVTVTNVATGLSSPQFQFNPFTGVATAWISYGDPGWLDDHTVVFNWGDGATSNPSPTGSEHGQPDATGTFNAGHPYALGCVANAPSVTVTDDDGAATTHPYSGGLDHYSVAFQAPIQDGVRNIVKPGNVIPVKLQITNCAGQPVLGKTLSINYVVGDIYDDAAGTTLLPVDSVSGADTTGVMRQVDGKYMYNLSTKGLATNQVFTIVIREPSTNSFVASFVIQLKK